MNVSVSTPDFFKMDLAEAMAQKLHIGEAETAESKQAEELFTKLTTEPAEATAAELAKLLKATDPAKLSGYGLLGKLRAAAEDKNSAPARQGAMLLFSALATALGPVAEPYLTGLLPSVWERLGDKKAEVKAAAEGAVKAVTESLNPLALPHVLPHILAGLEDKKQWQTKLGALLMLDALVDSMPRAVAQCMPDIVPVLSASMHEIKEQVKTAAIATMTKVTSTIVNKDIENTLPAIISCIANPTEVPECIHKLGATTFVQAVEAPVLSILVPLLVRGLQDRQTAIKRKSAVIIDNMAKLVENPADAAVFLPQLTPELQKNADAVADPECRKVTGVALTTLMKITENGTLALEARVDRASVLATITAAITAAHPAAKLDAFSQVPLDYISALCANLMQSKNFEQDTWTTKAITPYLAPMLPAAAVTKVCAAVYEKCYKDVEARKAAEEDEGEGEDLCNCEFSLAYGAKILLNNTRMRLKRGHRYGLCGANGTGKTTLMRAINNDQVEGFPPKDVLKTIFVEHDIDGSQAEMSAVEYVVADKTLNVDAVAAEKALRDVGFTDELCAKAVGALSGGWKMKLALARAMLSNADILLLDEPTNHLDVNNVKWLMNHLISLKHVTCLIVSHDSKFLDTVCTDILHYENRKLKNYRGNLSEFVKRVPEAKSYYDLGAAQLKFKLPEPGFLEGVKTKDRAIIKLSDVSFKYPNTERLIFTNASVACCLNSRVACVGANGAGKSTLIKVLTGETEATSGTVWRHPNVRIAYVAQHAFHHVEQHLDKTPVEYIQWRFAVGEDREAQQKDTRQVTEEEAKKMEQKFVHDGVKRKVEKILGRRKLRKDYEYEVQWEGLPIDQTTWLTRDVLEDMGFTKMVNEVDVREAAAMGLFARPLTTANVQKHLDDLGLEPEFSTHNRIRGLSGGQKVKVVLAAATWQQPHIIVLDEPTNYLDRESLGALANAIKDFGGGIIMITHNSEFSQAVCPETWTVADGKVVVEGATFVAKEKVEYKKETETVDAFGNTVKIKEAKKKLSNKEKKERAKFKKAARERGEVVSDTDDEA